MNASFEEKSVWIQFAGMALGLGAYFIVAGRLIAEGVRAMPAYAAVFMVAVAAMVVFLIAAYTLTAILSRPEARDERDRLIAWRAEHHSSWIVAVGVLAAITCMVLGIDNIWTANLLLLSLALSHMLGYTLQILAYRRGIPASHPGAEA